MTSWTTWRVYWVYSNWGAEGMDASLLSLGPRLFKLSWDTLGLGTCECFGSRDNLYLVVTIDFAWGAMCPTWNNHFEAQTNWKKPMIQWSLRPGYCAFQTTPRQCEMNLTTPWSDSHYAIFGGRIPFIWGPFSFHKLLGVVDFLGFWIEMEESKECSWIENCWSGNPHQFSVRKLIYTWCFCLAFPHRYFAGPGG